MCVHFFCSDAFLIGIQQSFIQILDLSIEIRFVLKVSGSLFIFQIAKIITQHLSRLIPDAEEGFVIVCADDLIYAFLNVKEQQTVRFPGFIRNLDQFFPISGHGTAMILRRINEIIDSFFADRFDALEFSAFIADPDHDRTAVRIGKSRNQRRQLRRLDLSRFSVKILILVLRYHVVQCQESVYIRFDHVLNPSLHLRRDILELFCQVP